MLSRQSRERAYSMARKKTKTDLTTKTRISIAIDSELLLDIYYKLGKIPGKIDPTNSLGLFIERKLRPQVPHRNIQDTARHPLK